MNILINNKYKIIGLIHRVYLTYLKNSKKYLASTKTKSQVQGGGRKPWRQKGTGNARAGSIRSPLWVGGGVSFGPKFHLVSKKINKKERKLAISLAFLLKKKNCIFLNKQIINNFTDIKTNLIIKLLKSLNIAKNEKILFLLNNYNKNFFLSTRNLKNIKISTFLCLNINNLLNYNKIISFLS
jgi:large subunit ribosomal protein L4